MSWLEKMELMDKLYKGLGIAVVRCHHSVNDLVIHSSRKLKRSGEPLRPVLHQVQKFLVDVVMMPSQKNWRRPCVYF